MVRPDVARRHLARATARLEQAAALIERPLAQFMDDVQGRDLASFYLLLAVQEAVDLAAHWVSDAGWPSPKDAGSTFDLIADRGGIDRELATRLRVSIGLRNRIAHGYADVDHERLHREFTEGASTLRRFFAVVAEAARL
jgi:uncharacterized protein YutE (UPF0331/DUF86 family)